jgi:hypothetical protein
MEIMQHHNRFTRRLLLAGGLAAALGIGGAGVHRAAAHEATCPVCKLDVVQDTQTQDNEVALKFGRKRIEYRCVWCALKDAPTYNGDVTILAPSEVKGKPVIVSRKAGKWSLAPETAVFVGEKVNHRSCQIGYRAFSGKPGFDAHQKKNPELLKDSKPLTLEQMVELAK